MERVWLYLRGHYLSNRAYADYDELFDATRDAWNALTVDRFRSLCHAHWLAGVN
jgi:hypothetical protein